MFKFTPSKPNRRRYSTQVFAKLYFFIFLLFKIVKHVLVLCNEVTLFQMLASTLAK